MPSLTTSTAGANAYPSDTRNAWQKRASNPGLAELGTLMTVPWLRPATASLKPGQFAGKRHGETSTRSNWQPSASSTGPIAIACSGILATPPPVDAEAVFHASLTHSTGSPDTNHLASGRLGPVQMIAGLVLKQRNREVFGHPEKPAKRCAPLQAKLFRQHLRNSTPRGEHNT